MAFPFPPFLNTLIINDLWANLFLNFLLVHLGERGSEGRKGAAMPTSSAFGQEIGRMRRQVEDLFVPHPFRYWADMTMSAGCGWAAYWTAAISAPFSSAQLLALLLAVLLLYRAL